MPFIDFHKFEGITVEDLKNAHIADLAAQDQYGSFIYGSPHDQILIVIEQLSIRSLGVTFHFE